MGTVYLFYRACTGYTKIGVSQNHHCRFRELNSKTRPLTIWGAFEVDDPYGHEDFLHRQFNAKRIQGEWFNLSAEDVVRIGAYFQFVSGNGPFPFETDRPKLAHHCLRCDYDWNGRMANLPKACPRCKARKWSEPAREPRRRRISYPSPIPLNVSQGQQ